MIFAAMAETGATPAETYMIGDSRFDMEMAAAAGVNANRRGPGAIAPG